MSDLISRQAAFIALNKRAENVSLKTRIGLLDAVRVIGELPSVESERKTGKWMPHMVTAKCESIDHDVCSECHVCFYGEPTWSWKYCPNCGKPMEVQNAKDINSSIKLDDFDRSGEEWR